MHPSEHLIQAENFMLNSVMFMVPLCVFSLDCFIGCAIFDVQKTASLIIEFYPIPSNAHIISRILS